MIPKPNWGDAQDTGSKPFHCKECQRCFSRQDSLARHEKLHTHRRAPRDVPSPPDSVSKPTIPDNIRTIHQSDHNSFIFHEATTGEVYRTTDLQSAPASNTMTLSPDLDCDLIWPDNEDLFQTIMSTEPANQWQIPLGTIQFPASPTASTSDIRFGTPCSFDERPASIDAIPSGGNHQAVQDVSKLISNFVIVDIPFPG